MNKFFGVFFVEDMGIVFLVVDGSVFFEGDVDGVVVVVVDYCV